MKGAIYAVLGVICAIVAAVFFYFQVNTGKNDYSITNLYVAVPALILALIFTGLFLAGRVNKEEEIHITK